MRLAIIVAVADNGVIGKDNALPWKLPEDMRHFKQVTMGKPIIMGRKTFESIGKPLPGRTNIVISRNGAFTAEGVRCVSSLEEALLEAEQPVSMEPAEEAVVIGGSEIYQVALPLADRLYITEVHANVEGDAVLPRVEWDDWREVRREHHVAQAPNPYDYSFVFYERARA
jgi:dihydrofolate reductase